MRYLWMSLILISACTKPQLVPRTQTVAVHFQTTEHIVITLGDHVIDSYKGDQHVSVNQDYSTLHIRIVFSTDTANVTNIYWNETWFLVNPDLTLEQTKLDTALLVLTQRIICDTLQQ
jgi:hypothetical protein